MSDIFSQAIDDIFAVKDFQEMLEVGDRKVVVISYSGNTDTRFTEFGVDPGDTISVTVKAGEWSPSRGDKVVFRGSRWRVDTVYVDSHNLTRTVYLKSLESK